MIEKELLFYAVGTSMAAAAQVEAIVLTLVNDSNRDHYNHVLRNAMVFQLNKLKELPNINEYGELVQTLEKLISEVPVQ